jgi:O-antigen ligase
VILLFNKNENRKFHFTYKFIVWFGILFTMTRGGIIVSLVALSVVFFQYLRKSSKLYKYIGYSFLVVLVFMFSQVVIFVSNFNISSLVSRFFIINGAINTIYQNPFLGTGLASQVAPVTSDIDFSDYTQISDNVLDTFDNRETHNTILQIGIEMGILGMLAFASLIINLIAKLRKIYKSIIYFSNDNQDVYASLYLILFLVLSINMNSYLYLKLLWVIIGLLAGLNKSNIKLYTK